MSAFDFTYEIVQIKTKKTWDKLEYWIWMNSIISSFRPQEKIMEPLT